MKGFSCVLRSSDLELISSMRLCGRKDVMSSLHLHSELKALVLPPLEGNSKDVNLTHRERGKLSFKKIESIMYFSAYYLILIEKEEKHCMMLQGQQD